MCSSPHVASTPAPQPAQPADLNSLNKGRNTAGSSAMAGGSLLTSPSGIANSALNTGQTSLLGS